MKRILIFLICLTPVLSTAQTPRSVYFGGRAIDTAYTEGSLRVDSAVRFVKYRNTDTTLFASFDPYGKIIMRRAGGAGADSSVFATRPYVANTYVSKTGSYANPSFITSLPYTKITGTPAIPDTTSLSGRIDAKQPTLISGINIKTVNGASVLGSGDISVSAVVDSSVYTTRNRTDSLNKRQPRFFSPRDYTGWVEGNPSYDNTVAVQACINAAAVVNATVRMPSNTLVSSIHLPFYSTDNGGTLHVIHIVGESNPAQFYGTVNNYPLPQVGSILRSNATSGAVIDIPYTGGGFGGISLIELVLENLTIRALNPGVSAVQAGRASQLVVRNVQIDNNQYASASVQPTSNSTGLETPVVNNGALTRLDNVSISGFAYGCVGNEHTDADGLQLTANKIGLLVKSGYHSQHYRRVTSQRNQIGVFVEQSSANGLPRFSIDQLDIEHAGTGQTDSTTSWQNTIADFSDSGGYARGSIVYAPTKGGIGQVGADNFIRIGGNADSFCTRIIGAPPCINYTLGLLVGLPAVRTNTLQTSDNLSAGLSSYGGLRVVNNSTDGYANLMWINGNGDIGQTLFTSSTSLGGALANRQLSFLSTSPNGVQFLTTASAPITFATGGTDVANVRMQIRANGQIGIGTFTGASQVNIGGGDIQIQNPGSGIILVTPDGTKAYKITITNAGNIMATQQ